MLNIFYDKNFYISAYKNWTFKKALLQLLIICFLLALLNGMKIYRFFKPLTDIVSFTNFCQSLPKIIEFKNNDGMYIYDDKNEPVDTFSHKYFTFDFNRENFSREDFQNKYFCMNHKNFFLTAISKINNFDITKLNFNNLTFDSLRIEIKELEFLVFANGEFRNKVTFNQVIGIFKRIVFFIMSVLILTIFLSYFSWFIVFLFAFSFIICKILNKKNQKLDYKKLFNSLVPIGFVYVIVTFIFSNLLNFSFFSGVFIFVFYLFFVPFKFFANLNKQD